MAVMTEKTILLKGHDRVEHDEGVANGAITPGMAIFMQSDGGYLQESRTQANALKSGLKIAVEDALQGKTITDAYATGNRIFFVSPKVGMHIGAFVKSGANIAVGDLLVVEGAGSGLFVEAAGTETKAQLQALESSGGALGANGHIKCEVITD